MIFLGALVFLLTVSATVIFLASGYRLDLKKREVHATGMLVVTSLPDGAAVFVNDVLTSATNTAGVLLTEGDYTVRLEKQGYHSWSKKIKIQKGLVSKLEALLSPLYPELKPLTFTGAANPAASPDGSRLVFLANSEPQKGIWFLDLSERPFNLLNKPQLLLEGGFTPSIQFLWSPDGKSFLVRESGDAKSASLFDLGTKSVTVVSDLSKLYEKWQQELKEAQKNQLKSLPTSESEKINRSSRFEFSPDATKILWTEELAGEKTFKIKDLALASTNQDIGETQVYKVAEGKFAKFFWHPDSRHFFILEKEDAAATNGSIFIAEIDGENRQQVLSGIILGENLFVSPSGSRIILLTSFNPELRNFNLYSISLH